MRTLEQNKDSILLTGLVIVIHVILFFLAYFLGL